MPDTLGRYDTGGSSITLTINTPEQLQKTKDLVSKLDDSDTILQALGLIPYEEENASD